MTGLKIVFSTGQNNDFQHDIEYFFADTPKDITTGCIGLSCEELSTCSLVEIETFPLQKDPITGLIFDVDTQSKQLRGLTVKIGENRAN